MPLIPQPGIVALSSDDLQNFIFLLQHLTYPIFVTFTDLWVLMLLSAGS